MDLAANSGCPPARCAVLAKGKTVHPPHELGKDLTHCSEWLRLLTLCVILTAKLQCGCATTFLSFFSGQGIPITLVAG